MRLVNYEKNNEIIRGIYMDEMIYSMDDPGTFEMHDDVKVTVPTLPTKIICVGMNYPKHASEMNYEVPSEPVIFIKPNSSMIMSGQPIVWPKQSENVQFEGELGVVIGNFCKDVSESEALKFVSGYCVVNDVTARDLQKMDGQWLNAKGFDTFLPISSWIQTDVNYRECELISKVNGSVRQKSKLSEMIFSVEEVIAYLSSIMTLLPGDLICMGTPAGDKRLNVGDRVEIEITGIGKVSNLVVKYK